MHGAGNPPEHETMRPDNPAARHHDAAETTHPAALCLSLRTDPTKRTLECEIG